eukprot:TRINITY_DN11430_c0_g1_i1.p1 TRINITY_DN11430_c0_g1~~TRINITY_DN11430_c0_g1_i1.p1  ORF type:complete len:560 (+),score=72.66 TRINITY_DN11430_c0_g1_i1:51-1730(+)
MTRKRCRWEWVMGGAIAIVIVLIRHWLFSDQTAATSYEQPANARLSILAPTFHKEAAAVPTQTFEETPETEKRAPALPPIPQLPVSEGDPENITEILLPSEQWTVDNYTLAITFDGASCRGSVSVVNRNCPTTSRPLSRVAWVRRYLQRLGPDVSRVRLEAKREALIVALRHQEKCHYTAQFQLSSKDLYHVQAQVLFRKFNGVIDPPATGKFAGWYNVVRFPSLGLRCTANGMTDETELPPCRSLSEPGRWTTVHVGPDPKLGVTANTQHVWFNYLQLAGQVFRRWGAFMHWTPYARCTYRAFSANDLLQRLTEPGRKRRWLFIGDSMTRSLYFPFARRLIGSSQRENFQSANMTISWKGVELVYLRSEFLRSDEPGDGWTEILNATGKYDVVVTGYGSWPASDHRRYGGLWDLDRFRHATEVIATQLRRFANITKARVIWHQHPATPWDERGPFCNNARFRVLNAVARAIMTRHGFEIFDLWSVSEVMLHTAIRYPPLHFTYYHVPVEWSRLLGSYIVDNPNAVPSGWEQHERAPTDLEDAELAWLSKGAEPPEQLQ